MKLKLYNIKKLSSVILVPIVLCGCNNFENTKHIIINESDFVTDNNPVTTTPIITEIETEIYTTILENDEALGNNFEITEYYTEPESEVLNVDEIVIDEFNSKFEEIEYLIENFDIEGNYELLKDKGLNFFTTCVDFIFYNEPIKGITFNDITDTTKEKIYNMMCYIDNKICNYIPDYKESLGNKYAIIKEFTSEKYYYLLDKIKEHIGEENYNLIDEFKDYTIEEYKNGSEEIKTYLKKWYENIEQKNIR